VGALVRSKVRLDVRDRPIQRDKLRVVEFGDLDAEAMVDGGDESQEIHGIDVESLAQICTRIDGCEIDLGRDIVELFQHHLANIGRAHSFSGSPSTLPISAKNNAPACPSLTRWSAARVIVTTERGPTAPSTTQGRATTFPKPTIATCGG
jgi:hypothetical protein